MIILTLTLKRNRETKNKILYGGESFGADSFYMSKDDLLKAGLQTPPEEVVLEVRTTA